MATLLKPCAGSGSEVGVGGAEMLGFQQGFLETPGPGARWRAPVNLQLQGKHDSV